MHLVPTTFDLQVHTPLELHDVEVDPEELHPHAEIISISSILSQELIF